MLLNSLGFPGSSTGKESACNVGELDSITGLGRSPGGQHGKPLQYSCLENPREQKRLVGLQSMGWQRVGTRLCKATTADVCLTETLKILKIDEKILSLNKGKQTNKKT